MAKEIGDTINFIIACLVVLTSLLMATSIVLKNKSLPASSSQIYWLCSLLIVSDSAFMVNAVQLYVIDSDGYFENIGLALSYSVL